MLVGLPLGGTDSGRSGIGTYVRAIVPHVHSSLVASGHELLAFGNAQELWEYRDALAGVRTARVPAPPAPALSALWYLTQLARYAKSHGVDVLLYPAAQRRCCLLRPLPTVAVVHDLGQLKLKDKYDPLRMAYFKHVALPLIARSTRPVAISKATRDDMVDALGLAADGIAVVPNGVDCDRFVPLDSSAESVREMRAALGLPGPYVLYPARLEHPAKNHVRLVEAFARSALRDTHVLALSGGDWGGRAVIEATAQKHGVEQQVKFLGFVDNAIIPILFAVAEAVVMVGLTEGFGLPALEGLACGRPICAANAGALPEVVGDLAAMCDPLDVASIQQALERAASDAELRRRCAEEGPAWARRWSWETTGSRLAQICVDVAASDARA